MKHILIIKLGALGDFIQATAIIADIRAHHKGDHITLLTTKGMMPLAENNPNIDAISIDPRAKLWDFSYLRDLRKKLKGFDMVYDLQTNDRTNFYHMLAGMPKWNGIALFCSHPQKNPMRNKMHSIDRMVDQVKVAGVQAKHLPSIAYMATDISDLLQEYGLKKGKYSLLIPGGSAHRPEKRWTHFAELAQEMVSKGETVVLIGGPAEALDLEKIENAVEGVINLCAKTSLSALTGLCVNAKQFIGNDTGPSHMAAACNASGVVLFGSASDPKLCAPKSQKVSVLQKDNIADISVEEVLNLLH